MSTEKLTKLEQVALSILLKMQETGVNRTDNEYWDGMAQEDAVIQAIHLLKWCNKKKEQVNYDEEE